MDGKYLAIEIALHKLQKYKKALLQNKQFKKNQIINYSNSILITRAKNVMITFYEIIILTNYKMLNRYNSFEIRSTLGIPKALLSKAQESYSKSVK